MLFPQIAAQSRYFYLLSSKDFYLMLRNSLLHYTDTELVGEMLLL